jgi:hypothetical protein
VNTFNTIIGQVLADNPFGCTFEVSSETMPRMVKSRESYGARIMDENDGRDDHDQGTLKGTSQR